MRSFAGFCLIVAISFASLAQMATVPARWIGTWKLNVEKSTFGIVLIPGMPADFKILSQTLRIDQDADRITIGGDTNFSAAGAAQTDSGENTLRLDGSPTNAGAMSLSFRPIDNSAFEIVSTINDPNTNVSEVSRYAFSSDGKKLTATKIQTERALVPTGMDKSKGAVIRTSTFILVYDKLSEHE